VRQGDIHQYGRFRVLVVSADAHNQVRTAWVAPIVHGAVDAPPYRIPLIDPDPLGGFVDLDRLSRVDLDSPPLATMTGATMARVRDAIATVFAD
jgi:mRNA-degrading endonuclease toxin of MazEF toxin-antitoxin module